MPISRIKTDGIQDNAITSAKIGDTNIQTDDIADGSVTTAKLDTNITVAGNITANTAIFAPSISGSSDTNTSLSFPGSDVVQLNNAATARYKFHNLNGTSLFEVQASSTGGSGAGGAFLKFKGSNGTPVDIASIDGSMTNGNIGSETGILSFFTMDSGTNSEKVRIFSNGSMAVPNGISLGNGISAAASNLLDDYEEGGWTPNIGGTATYTNAQGTYTKIGRYVCASWDITINAIGTGASTTMYGFPFTASLGPLGVDSGHISFYSGIANNVYSVDCYIVANQTYIHFTGHTSVSGNIYNVLPVFQNGARILGTVHYLAN